MPPVAFVLGRCAWLWYFYPRPPRGGRRCSRRVISGFMPTFLSTPSARRATLYHATRLVYCLFLSTPSVRRATAAAGSAASAQQFLSTPSARRATRGKARKATPRKHFYPRPPRGGRRGASWPQARRLRFLSTPSARRATPLCAGRETPKKFLSTPSARRATLLGCCRIVAHPISIHALREEGDYAAQEQFRHITNFYPRPPRGGRPWTCLCPTRTTQISIHALREEGDPLTHRAQPDPAISIHALREEGDLLPLSFSLTTHQFLSTPSARRATVPTLSQEWMAEGFLSTPSARRATWHCRHMGRTDSDFYPRPPRGGRPGAHGQGASGLGYFYPRPPRGGRPQERLLHSTRKYISIHALREEGDLPPLEPPQLYTKFLSTPSARRATPPMAIGLM